MSEYDSSTGVWAVVQRDYDESIQRVFPTEIEALRWVNDYGSGKVWFVPWGVSVEEIGD